MNTFSHIHTHICKGKQHCVYRIYIHSFRAKNRLNILYTHVCFFATTTVNSKPQKKNIKQENQLNRWNKKEKKKKQTTTKQNIQNNGRRKKIFEKTKLAPCIHSSHNDLFLFWNQFFRICQECISTDSIYMNKKKKKKKMKIYI